MPRVADPEVRRWWTELVEQFESCHDTVAEFCAKHEVSVSAFYSWRRKLAGGDQGRLIPVCVDGQSQATSESPHVLFRFDDACEVHVPVDQTELVVDAIVALAGRKRSTERDQ